MSLTPNEAIQYDQHLKLEAIGLKGQVKLKNARVLCIGAGGLGSSLLYYLAAAGVGTIGIVDDDVVELHNLQRQILYQHQHIGSKKCIAAKQQLMALNPHIHIDPYDEKFRLKNAKELIKQYDIVADCTDNFATRFLVNDTCFNIKKPFVFASVSQFQGQCSVFLGEEGPCFRCLFPYDSAMDALRDCSEGGVLGVLPGLLGAMQGAEIIKWILQLPDLLVGKLLMVDILKMQFKEYRLTQNPECQLCIYQQAINLPSKFNSNCNESDNLSDHCISANELRRELNKGEAVFLLDVRTPEEFTAYNLGGVLIPLNELSQRLAELDRNKMIVVYCKSGNRSIAATKILINQNFGVKYLQGGLIQWQELINAL
ncbi:MAG: HesA/MoeB/ThiF family protein [Proteobacteria bacterium]|nr:HesA/MoeB/ThiF family protein [Pseudomonadota bacterium]